MKLHARTLPPDCWRRLRDSLDHWPEAALLLDPEGRVAAANPAAQDQWQRGGEPLQGRPAATLLSDLRRRGDGAPLLSRAALHGSPRTVCGEGEDAQGRGWLLRCLPLVDERQGLHGWLLLLVDVTLHVVDVDRTGSCAPCLRRRGRGGASRSWPRSTPRPSP